MLNTIFSVQALTSEIKQRVRRILFPIRKELQLNVQPQPSTDNPETGLETTRRSAALIIRPDKSSTEQPSRVVRSEVVNNVVEHGVHGHGNQGARRPVARAVDDGKQ
jgi:hypothetical protein